MSFKDYGMKRKNSIKAIITYKENRPEGTVQYSTVQYRPGSV